MTETAYRLVRRARTTRTPALDEHQRHVVEHAGGPLLVLAGPGTGKTTTIAEAVVDRIENRETDPERVLVLTFSRKAALELRERITGRLRRTTRSPLALTFHSYAYALLRREAVLADEPPPRLLSGPEQMLEVRRLLQGELEDGPGAWPKRLRPALATRGFADELRDFILRSAERGLGPTELINLGRLHGRGDWIAVGRFLHRYNARFDVDPHPSYDYAELVRAAAGLLTDDAVRRRERDAYDVVFVDEYQDTDPAQEFLLHQLAGDGRELVVVGDPDQSIYGFRGADVRGIQEFPHRFPRADGGRAPVVALQVCRRMGPHILEASRRVARRLPAAGGSGQHRALRLPGEEMAESLGVLGREGGVQAPPVAPKLPAGAGQSTGPAAPRDEERDAVRVLVADSASQEAALIADELRRAHLLDDVPWSQMAVLVRSAKLQVPALRRALAAAGVPVVVGGADVPLASEPGTRPFLLLLRCALRPALLDEEAAVELLTGPLGGSDALGLRRLRRALHDLARLAGEPPAADCLAAVLDDPRDLAIVHPSVGEPAERVASLIATARRAADGGTAEDALWAVWTESGLAERLMDLSVAGGARGASADRDLDAMVKLFEHAARFTDRMPHAGPLLFLDDLASQDIPGDTLAEQAPEGEVVRILTAHRSKGLEWDVVVVAGVQEGIWPDLRLRGSLLGIEDLVEIDSGTEIIADEVAGASIAAKLLDEERRLFYVAATRARRRLVVTAVGGDDTEERPSRFLGELLPGALEHAGLDERTRWLSLRALVADLRSAVSDPERPEPVRRAAAGHLARLARVRVQGADPAEWYALRELSDDGPAFDEGEQITISPSQVETFTTCGLRWLLASCVGADDGGLESYATMGKVIHAVAELASVSDVGEADIAGRLDEIWSELDFRNEWYSGKQRETASAMVTKFLSWHRENPRELSAIEEPFKVDLGNVVIKGRVDRAERDDEGRAVIIDIKTSSSAVPKDDVARHPQLGVYQYAVALGAFARLGLIEPGGAELIQVGGASLSARVRVQRQEHPGSDEDPEWPKKLVEAVATGMSSPIFEARVNDKCRTCPVRSCCPVHDEGGQIS